MASDLTGDWNYLIIWEFQVRPGMEQKFEQDYGENGLWARFFRHGAGYVRTELVRDLEQPRRYVTLDFWISRAAYSEFRSEHAAQYKAIDEKCEAMTESEKELGTFEKPAHEVP